MGRGFWTSISWPQQVILPSPALVHSISVPHFGQRYLLPSWLAIYFFSSMGLPQQWTVPSPARVTMNSAPHLVQQYFLPI
jgi:hypothetical protein